jgi:hypothetical protein
MPPLQVARPDAPLTMRRPPTFDVASLITGVVIVATVAAYLGALLAIVRPDHRNPVTRPVMDWIERHAQSQSAE